MRRSLAGLAVAGLMLLTATPALADTARVNAAESITRWDSTETCGVIVDDQIDMEVNVYCFGDGRTWFKVRVPDVTGEVTRIRVARDGDCSGTTITHRKRGDVVTVKVRNVGEFDCYYSSVVIRHTG